MSEIYAHRKIDHHLCPYFRVPIDSNFDSLSTGAANLHVNVSLKLTDEIYRHEMSQKDSQMFKDKSSLLMSQVGMTCESAYIDNQ